MVLALKSAMVFYADQPQYCLNSWLNSSKEVHTLKKKRKEMCFYKSYQEVLLDALITKKIYSIQYTMQILNWR